MCMKVEREELKCPCCGLNLITDELLDKLRVARYHANVPFKFNSGTRCVEHNKEVHGSATSAHLFGYAADISVENNEQRYRILDGLLKAGFKRILVYANFIHVDVDLDRGAPLLKLM